MGAGGLQAMVKSGLPIRGKRVVVAGTGPLLLAVAAYLRQHGAEIPIVCEQTSWSTLARFSMALLSQPGKIVEGLRLKRELAGIPFAANTWPLAAQGRQSLESVTISRGGTPETIQCDFLACGFHLVPNVELQLLLGCEIQAGQCTGRRISTNDGRRRLLCGRTDRHRRRAVGACRGTDCRSCCRRWHGKSSQVISWTGESTALCAALGSGISCASRTKGLAVRGYDRMPLRGYSLFASPAANIAGARRSCTHAAEWVRVRGECADRQPNFSSNGSRIRFDRLFSPRALKTWLRLPVVPRRTPQY